MRVPVFAFVISILGCASTEREVTLDELASWPSTTAVFVGGAGELHFTLELWPDDEMCPIVGRDVRASINGVAFEIFERGGAGTDGENFDCSDARLIAKDVPRLALTTVTLRDPEGMILLGLGDWLVERRASLVPEGLRELISGQSYEVAIVPLEERVDASLYLTRPGAERQLLERTVTDFGVSFTVPPPPIPGATGAGKLEISVGTGPIAPPCGRIHCVVDNVVTTELDVVVK